MLRGAPSSRVSARRGLLAGAAPFSVARAQGAPLKVGVLLPRSGVQAGIGQDCQRGVDIAPAILKELGMPALDIMNGDTESNVQTARSTAEKLIDDGAQLLVGAFDSGQTTAIAQVAEQKGIPLVINIAAAPQITEQGYKFVFRNFPTAVTILTNAFQQQKEIFKQAGEAPKSVVFMHVNDTFGTAMAGGIGHVMPKMDMPYKIAETISYDPQGARPVGRGRQGQGDRRRCAPDGQPPQRRDPDHARADQAALDAGSDHQHGPRLVRGSVSQDAREILATDRSPSCPGTIRRRSSARRS